MTTLDQTHLERQLSSLFRAEAQDAHLPLGTWQEIAPKMGEPDRQSLFGLIRDALRIPLAEKMWRNPMRVRYVAPAATIVLALLIALLFILLVNDTDDDNSPVPAASPTVPSGSTETAATPDIEATIEQESIDATARAGERVNLTSFIGQRKELPAHLKGEEVGPPALVAWPQFLENTAVVVEGEAWHFCQENPGADEGREGVANGTIVNGDLFWVFNSPTPDLARHEIFLRVVENPGSQRAVQLFLLTYQDGSALMIPNPPQYQPSPTETLVTRVEEPVTYEVYESTLCANWPESRESIVLSNEADATPTAVDTGTQRSGASVFAEITGASSITGAIRGEEAIWLFDRDNATLYKLDAGGQREWSKFLPQSIFGLAISESSLVVADALGGKVLFLDLSGEETSRFSVPLDVTLAHAPVAFVESDLWIRSGGKVSRYDSNGTIETELPITVGRGQPWAASSIAVWVVDEELSTVVGFRRDGSKVAEFNALSAMGLSGEEVIGLEWYGSKLWVHVTSASGQFDPTGQLESQIAITLPDPGDVARYRRIVSSTGILVHESVGRQVRTSNNQVVMFPFTGGQPVVLVSDLSTGWLFGDEQSSFYVTAQGSSVYELDPMFSGTGTE